MGSWSSFVRSFSGRWSSFSSSLSRAYVPACLVKHLMYLLPSRHSSLFRCLVTLHSKFV